MKQLTSRGEIRRADILYRLAVLEDECDRLQGELDELEAERDSLEAELERLEADELDELEACRSDPRQLAML